MGVRRVVTRVLATLGATLIATTALVALQPVAVSDALSGSQFDPGNIISDANFYDSNAMSEADIQSFLQSKIGSCTNGQCLNVLTVTTSTKAADDMCAGGYAGAAAEPVSRIIYKVEQGCGISAKVILVTLQKEESLVTARAPSASALRTAMGYGCPDTAACDSTFYGVFNQIFQAARQFKRYGLSAPDNTQFHYFPVGVPSTIRFNPNDVVNGVVCGSSSVTIQNKATAALYYYTPYQPNPAALANLSGAGDGCSTHGNRNFWVYYNTWFGPSSYPPGSPDGDLTAITALPRAIRISGWAVDPTTPTAQIGVAFQVAGSWFSTIASLPSTDAGTNSPGAGPNHGYDMTIPWTPGLTRVCVTLVNIGPGANVTYACRMLTVPDFPAPVGAIETAKTAPGSVSLTGWAVRPDAPTGAVNVAAQVGNSWFQLTSGQPDAVAPTQVTGAGANQGYSGTLSLPPGQQKICIWATSTSGVSSVVTCSTVAVPSAPMPQGDIETTLAGPGSISVVGWAVRPDAPTGAVNVAAQIGSAWYQLTSGQPDSVAPTKVPGAGANQGFSGVLATTPGVKNVCIWATATSGVSTQLACKSVTVAAVPTPVGAVESTTVGPGSISVVGWAVRPDAPTGAVNVAAQIGNSWFQLTSGQPDAVAPTKAAGAGPNQGFSGTIAAPPGQQQLCIWATATSGIGMLLSCTSVTIPATPTPVGAIESAVGGSGTIALTGWALRPDAPTASTNVAAQIGSNWYQLTSGRADAIAPTVVAAAGPNQGFAGTISTTAGVKNVCIWVTSSGGVGVQVTCAKVTVR